MTDDKRRANAEKQARHKYALMTEVRQIRAELNELPQRIVKALVEQEQSKDHENGG